jgi:sugar O-acyltransferase (sialic acid O-acetyltransferase NeuD family)
MKPIAIYGAGSFGREVLMLIHQINEKKPQWNPIGFYDDNRTKGDLIHSIPVLGNTDDLNKVDSELFIVLGLGNCAVKIDAFNRIKNPNLKFATLIHPIVQLAAYQNCEVGEGSIICGGNIITVDIKIGRHVLLNIGSTFGHDTVIEDFVSVMPGSNISGNVHIKEGVYIGSGSSVLNGVVLNKGAVLGAGAVAISDVAENTTVVGVPAKPVKTKTSIS